MVVSRKIIVGMHGPSQRRQRTALRAPPSQPDAGVSAEPAPPAISSPRLKPQAVRVSHCDVRTAGGLRPFDGCNRLGRSSEQSLKEKASLPSRKEKVHFRISWQDPGLKQAVTVPSQGRLRASRLEARAGGPSRAGRRAAERRL